MDFKVEVSFYKLQGLEQEIKNLKAEKLEAFIGSRELKTGTSYDIYKLVDDNQKLNFDLQVATKVIRDYQDIEETIRQSYRNEVADKETRLQLLRSEIKGLKSALITLRIEAIDFKSALVVEISNVCDLDQEKQDLIQTLADKNDTVACLEADLRNSQNSKEVFNYVEGIRASYEQKLEEQHQTLTQEFNLLNCVIVEQNETITCLKAEKTQLETQLAATIARNTSFTLSGDYQVTKISKGESISNQAEEENPEDYDTWQGPETSTWDDDIDDDPDMSNGW